MTELHRDKRDATDMRDRKLGNAARIVATEYDDRWPCRGLTGAYRTPGYRPLDDVSREQRRVPYRTYPPER